MRRWIVFFSAVVPLLLWFTNAAAAEPRVGPPLTLGLTVFHSEVGDPPDPDTAALSVSGRECFPVNDVPTSVLVTVDRLPNQVFTTTPRAKGGWDVSIDVPVPVDGTYTVNAECDDYAGTKTYPEAQIDAADAVNVVAVPSTALGGGSSGSGGGGGIANTGSRTGTEITVALIALAVGTLLVLLGLPRRRDEFVAPVGSSLNGGPFVRWR